uniref:hypothetical protein n=1 Tax=uncultured Bacteroides sp. TaxID=162156 RepID=UPI0032202C2D
QRFFNVFAFFYRYYNHFVLIKCYWLKNLTIKLSGKITHTFFIYKTFCQKNHNSGQASFILGSYREFVAIVSLSINRAIGFRLLSPKGDNSFRILTTSFNGRAVQSGRKATSPPGCGLNISPSGPTLPSSEALSLLARRPATGNEPVSAYEKRLSSG